MATDPTYFPARYRGKAIAENRKTSVLMFPRKHPRLGDAYYIGRRRYFVTICTFHRAGYFARADTAAWMVRFMQRTAAGQRFLLHAWCVMPDHVHILLEGTQRDCELRAFVSELKKRAARAFESRFQRTLWQNYFYDHVVRTDESMHQIAAYIWHNPVRKGLCAEAAAYPHSGSATYDWKTRTPPVEPWLPPWKV